MNVQRLVQELEDQWLFHSYQMDCDNSDCFMDEDEELCKNVNNMILIILNSILG